MILLLTASLALPQSDAAWRDFLGRERYCVMRRKATEAAFSGRYYDWERQGTYSCAACHQPLFHSSAKFDAGNGWPNFRAPIEQRNVWIKEDLSFYFRRYEVLCRGCDSHLGHVFRDKSGALRYTINSISLEFDP